MKTKIYKMYGNFRLMSVKSNKYILIYSKTRQFISRPDDSNKDPLILAWNVWK